MAISKFSDVDEYGFKRDENFEPQKYEKFMEEYLPILARRNKKWTELMTKKRDRPLVLNRKLKRFIRKGIPTEFRPQVLMELSGANALKSRENSDYFPSLLSRIQDTDVVDSIQLDLSRTFPNNIYFSAPGHHQSQLYNILVAFANQNTAVGYCQGLNYVAGILILITTSDQTSFWLLKALVENILPDYFSPSMIGVLVDIEVLAELVRVKLPDVHKHLESKEFHWALIATKWFVCCYAEVLPTETVLRIWDCLFCEGSKILFRVGLTLIIEFRSSLLKCDDLSEVMNCFKEIQSSYFVLSCHSFMEKVFKYTSNLSTSSIQQLRAEKKMKIISEKKMKSR
ncbi:growth hormone-regulated TBC protein 1-A [Bemisia tabaci]|uniref:growth hormone-regulated TBC protein 1-A n=1 Tax=Bemisia tabaci TaxID=7038 RepID=UPI0008F9AC17|nr:PREDICTED: growth hormone-regulated TBC protein 1-A [Bemisia tabaci]